MSFDTADKQELVEFCPEDFIVEVDGTSYIVKLVKFNYLLSENYLRYNIVEPAKLPWSNGDVFKTYAMSAEHKEQRRNAKPFMREDLLV